jgi:hypothetical protein
MGTETLSRSEAAPNERFTRKCSDVFDAHLTSGGASGPVRVQGSHWMSQQARDSGSPATQEGQARHCLRAVGRACAERVRRNQDQTDRSWVRTAKERGWMSIDGHQPWGGSATTAKAIKGKGAERWLSLNSFDSRSLSDLL